MKWFYDVGANTGQTFDWLAGVAGPDWSVVCFEPSPRHMSRLLDRIDQESRLYQRVVLCPFALSDDQRMTPLFECEDPLADGLTPDWRIGRRRGPRDILIQTYRLSRYLCENTNKGDEVTIKIDAERSEFWILNDLLHCEVRDRVKRILVEWHIHHKPSWAPVDEANRAYIEAEYRKRGLPALEEWKL